MDLYIDVSRVIELTTFSEDSKTLTLGANTTLNQAMNIFKMFSNKSGFQYLRQMRDHIDLIAHVPVRNVSMRLV